MKKKVADYMTGEVTSIKANESMLEACRLLETRPFRHLPVVNEKGHIVGILSDRDLVNIDVFTGIAANLDDKDKKEATVEEFMHNVVFVAQPEDDLAAAGLLMKQNRVGALPVIDDMFSNKLVGILSYIDILRAYIDLSAQKNTTTIKPLYTEDLLNNWQERLEIGFPAGYREAVLTADEPINSLSYCIPFQHPVHSDFVVFARWNDQLFSFKRNQVAIYQISGNEKPEFTFEDFAAWQKLVHKAADRAFFDG